MTENFNQWWNEDLLTENNPHVDGTPAFWAWEGWCAGVKAEREACAQVCEDNAEDLSEGDWDSACINCADHIRAREQA